MKAELMLNISYKNFMFQTRVEQCIKKVASGRGASANVAILLLLSFFNA